MYTVKARYYADEDQMGESYVLSSDNGAVDTRLEVGTKVSIIPIECDHYWKGWIYNVRIYNRVLSAAEIANLAKTGLGFKED